MCFLHRDTGWRGWPCLYSPAVPWRVDIVSLSQKACQVHPSKIKKKFDSSKMKCVDKVNSVQNEKFTGKIQNKSIANTKSINSIGRIRCSSNYMHLKVVLTIIILCWVWYLKSYSRKSVSKFILVSLALQTLQFKL